MAVAQDVRILNERIDAAFRRRHQTRYVLMASKEPDGTISFFMNISPKDRRRRSVPLHSLETADLTYFEQVIAGIQRHTHLSIDYCGFGPKDYWPQSGRRIESKPHHLEHSAFDW